MVFIVFIEKQIGGLHANHVDLPRMMLKLTFCQTFKKSHQKILLHQSFFS